MSASPTESPNQYGWKIDNSREPKLDPAIVLATLYNIAKPKNAEPMSREKATQLIEDAADQARDADSVKIGHYKGVTLNFRPQGSTLDRNGWDLYSYLEKNPHVTPNDLFVHFNSSLEEMKLPEKHWGDKVMAEVLAKEKTAESAEKSR